MRVLLELGWLTGWVLGIIGFFTAHSARTEVRRLRALLEPPAAVAEAAPEPVIDAPSLAPPETRRDLEAVLTTNWAVWLGSMALLFAGVFLVRYAVEQELLKPAARCGLAALLGLALLAGAEWLYRLPGPALAGPFRIDQAPGGLAAGGTAILFGAAYGAGPFFGLLAPLPAFAAMAAASGIALAAALRYGPLTAATGIAGAFATPALVATQDPSLPGLFGYLFIVSVVALLVVRRTAWTWLGWAATFAGAGWVCYAAVASGPDDWAAALFIPAAAVAHLWLLPKAALEHPVGRRLAWVPFAALGGAGLVLALFAPGGAPRAALLLLSPIAIGNGVREPRLARLSWVAALFGLLTLLIWPTGPAASAVQAVIPEGKAEPSLIIASGLFAAFHAAAGLWLQRQTAVRLVWPSLVAGVPVLSLAVAYARIALFQPEAAWAACALALAVFLVGTASAAARAGDRARAGVHATGAVAALALGCAILLHDYWLTMAIALFLPPLARVEARADLPPLRQVALVVASLVIVRLVLNWYVLGYLFGPLPLANGLLAAYAVPAGSFALAAMLFRRRGDDVLVATFQSGAITFLALCLGLEVRHASTAGQLAGPGSLREIALHLLTIALQATAYLRLATDAASGYRVLGVAWRVLGGIALVGWVSLLVLNPMVTNASAGIVTLFVGYLAPVGLAVYARRRLTDQRLRVGLLSYAVIAGFAWVTLQIRQVFHPTELSLQVASVAPTELWGWSGGWLGYGILLMILAIRTGQRFLRLTALGVIGLVCVKVFAIDMAGLTGLWRVLSFLGLGIALIGLGVTYRRFVLPARQSAGD